MPKVHYTGDELRGDVTADVGPDDVLLKITRLRFSALLNGILVASLLLGVISTLIDPQYDWDIDNEIYYGQRLLQAELPWVHEYNDKLLFVSLLFTLPALIESVQIWRLMSLAAVGLAAIAMLRQLPYLSPFADLPRTVSRRTALTAALLYINLVLFLPGGITTINASATSFSLVATLLTLTHYAKQGDNPTLDWTRAGAVGLFAAASISIRPYLALPFLLILLWTPVLQLIHTRSRARFFNHVPFIAVSFLTLASLFLLNFIPYLITGQGNALVSGMTFLLSDLNPTPTLTSVATLLSQEPLFLWLELTYLATATFLGLRALRLKIHATWLIPPVSVMTALLLTLTTITWLSILGSLLATFFLSRLKRSVNRDSLSLAVALLALLASFLQSHWWPHYIVMTTGIASILLITQLTLGDRQYNLLANKQSRRSMNAVTRVFQVALATLLIALTTSFLVHALSKLLEASTKTEAEHSATPLLQSFETFIDEHDDSSIDFLAPTNMYLHWKQNESRHGFPHAANTFHISFDWWNEAPDSQSFRAFRSLDEYCQHLMVFGPSLIVDIRDSPVSPCLSSAQTTYRLNESAQITDDYTVDFYLRSPQKSWTPGDN